MYWVGVWGVDVAGWVGVHWCVRWCGGEGRGVHTDEGL